jgi:hypothetical protein
MAPFSLRCWKNGDCSTLEAMVAVEWLLLRALESRSLELVSIVARSLLPSPR